MTAVCPIPLALRCDARGRYNARCWDHTGHSGYHWRVDNQGQRQVWGLK